MAIETIIAAGIFSGVVAFIAHSITKAQDRRELSKYRTEVSNDFRRLADTIYTQYGTSVSEEVAEFIDEDDNVIPAHTEVRVVLENKVVAAAITEFQASLYR